MDAILESLIRECRNRPGDAGPVLYLADYYDLQGNDLMSAVVRRQAEFGLPLALNAVREIEAKGVATDYDWREVFGVGGGGNCFPKADACPPGAEVDLTPPVPEGVAEVIAAVNGENDGADWLGLFRMNDGRFVVAYGGCDYTGWD